MAIPHTRKRNGVLDVDQLPEPDAYDLDGLPWWQTSDGERVYAAGGEVYTPSGCRDLDAIEQDALAHLAAVAYARGITHTEEGSAG